jgi:hypothetical protein
VTELKIESVRSFKQQPLKAQLPICGFVHDCLKINSRMVARFSQPFSLKVIFSFSNRWRLVLRSLAILGRPAGLPERPF